MNYQRLLAIKLFPSGTGDVDEDNRMRATSCQDCGYPDAQGASMCESCSTKSAYRRQMAVDDFNLLMYGCHDPVHVFGLGYINPHLRGNEQFADP